MEDLGYYCVDNLPPALVEKFIELSLQSEGRIDKAAMVIDIRGGDFFRDLNDSLRQLDKEGMPYEILFL
ncbi:MAG: RNase adapter RapZ, partial [Syntrophomonadaceae bacterium]|nr:RNase adapter RapZ [Syntrophomonadaceae bacterium]